jgi:hypothetical protein
MTGPNKEGYWQACQTEIRTLTELKDAWELVDRETWMNVYHQYGHLNANDTLMDS